MCPKGEVFLEAHNSGFQAALCFVPIRDYAGNPFLSWCIVALLNSSKILLFAPINLNLSLHYKNCFNKILYSGRSF